MRGPKPPAIALAPVVRHELDTLVRRHSTPQPVALRGRIILAAAEGRNNAPIARREGVDVATVRLWRGRWLGLQPISLDELSVAERLAAAPGPGRRPAITAAQQCRIVAPACEAPSTAGRPVSQWTGREVADEIMRRGLVERSSRRHAAWLRNRGICSPTASAPG